jgi:hypothetical protein
LLPYKIKEQQIDKKNSTIFQQPKTGLNTGNISITTAHITDECDNEHITFITVA